MTFFNPSQARRGVESVMGKVTTGGSMLIFNPPLAERGVETTSKSYNSLQLTFGFQPASSWEGC
ncbi:hypothetical protein [Nostoc sp.]|uniref:hypothetical protein n=1 Tax=Nostoc sp. TaxID=1180 RepID=UPI003FA57A38